MRRKNWRRHGTGRFAALAEKLAHPIAEIRMRTLRNVKFKLTNELMGVQDFSDGALDALVSVWLKVDEPQPMIKQAVELLTTIAKASGNVSAKLVQLGVIDAIDDLRASGKCPVSIEADISGLRKHVLQYKPASKAPAPDRYSYENYYSAPSKENMEDETKDGAFSSAESLLKMRHRQWCWRLVLSGRALIRSDETALFDQYSSKADDEESIVNACRGSRSLPSTTSGEVFLQRPDISTAGIMSIPKSRTDSMVSPFSCGSSCIVVLMKRLAASRRVYMDMDTKEAAASPSGMGMEEAGHRENKSFTYPPQQEGRFVKVTDAASMDALKVPLSQAAFNVAAACILRMTTSRYTASVAPLLCSCFPLIIESHVGVDKDLQATRLGALLKDLGESWAAAARAEDDVSTARIIFAPLVAEVLQEAHRARVDMAIIVPQDTAILCEVTDNVCDMIFAKDNPRAHSVLAGFMAQLNEDASELYSHALEMIQAVRAVSDLAGRPALATLSDAAAMTQEDGVADMAIDHLRMAIAGLLYAQRDDAQAIALVKHSLAARDMTLLLQLLNFPRADVRVVAYEVICEHLCHDDEGGDGEMVQREEKAAEAKHAEEAALVSIAVSHSAFVKHIFCHGLRDSNETCAAHAAKLAEMIARACVRDMAVCHLVAPFAALVQCHAYRSALPAPSSILEAIVERSSLAEQLLISARGLFHKQDWVRRASAQQIRMSSLREAPLSPSAQDPLSGVVSKMGTEMRAALQPPRLASATGFAVASMNQLAVLVSTTNID